eukprot:scaffold1713_cov45-Cyclotella_meneghiniana.AAC.1
MVTATCFGHRWWGQSWWPYCPLLTPRFKSNSLTNQPETDTILSLTLLSVVGCWGVVDEAVIFDVKQPSEMDESEIFVFGRGGGGGAKSEEVEAAMTPPGELALALEEGRLKSRSLLRNSGRFSQRWVRHGFLCTSCCDCAQYCKAARPDRTDPAMQGHF